MPVPASLGFDEGRREEAVDRFDFGMEPVFCFSCFDLDERFGITIVREFAESGVGGQPRCPLECERGIFEELVGSRHCGCLVHYSILYTKREHHLIMNKCSIFCIVHGS
jgi:hypothetical protein